MGSRMARRLLETGHEITVWNRTPAAAEPLAAAGARVAQTPGEAATDADAVISCLRDDAASEAVWSDGEVGAFRAMKPGAIAIGSCTVSPERARRWGDMARQYSVVPVEAPVSGARQQVEAGYLLYFLGGDACDVERAKTILKHLGIAFVHVGELGHAAVVKLLANTLLATHVATLSELLRIIERQGLNADIALKALSTTTSWAPVAGYLARLMRCEEHSPQFPIGLMKKDLDYVGSLDGAQSLPMTQMLLARFDAAIAAGLEGENISALVKLQAAAG